ncbi:tripartite tricarboxylate transporter TctB [beta proteobacterium AAP99]|nr:tripartite tricarboxylate transporter TctB [beta proteobacterium AAP99]
MQNLKFVRGVVLMVIATLFGVASLRFPLGTVGRAGPGLFPLIISVMLALIGLAMLVQSRLQAPEPLDFKLRNIGFVIASLVGFTLIARYVALLPAIVFLVFVASLAGADYSVKRNLKISAALIVIAFGFRYGLGLQLTLW